MLTKGLDNYQGTAGNDTIIGSVENPTVNAELNTLSALDIINGGAGTDTLKIATNLATAVPLANVSSVEIIEVQGANAGGTSANGDGVSSTRHISQINADVLSANYAHGGAGSLQGHGHVGGCASCRLKSISSHFASRISRLRAPV